MAANSSNILSSSSTKKTKAAAIAIVGLCMISFLLDSISISISPTNTKGLRRLLYVVPKDVVFVPITDGSGGEDNNGAEEEEESPAHHLLVNDESFRIRANEFPYPLTCDTNELQTFLQSNNLLIDNNNDETSEKKFTLTLVYHIGMVGNWESVVADQFNTLIKCGTLDLADQLFVSYSNGEREVIDSFLYVLLGEGEHNYKHKLRRVVESTKSPWEAPAMNMMLDHCSSHINSNSNNNNRIINNSESTSTSPPTPPKKEEVIFYFHNKGTSKYTDDWRSKVHLRRTYAYSLYWRKYIEYYTIERPQLCLEKLLSSALLSSKTKSVDREDEDEEYYTSCGPNWRPAGDNWGNHYSVSTVLVSFMQYLICNALITYIVWQSLKL